MNPHSIRFQLTLWYATALFLCLAVVLGLFYVLTQQALFDQTDQTLISHGEPIVNLVSSPECCLTREQASTNQLLLQTLSNMPGMVVVIQSATGELLSSSLEDTLIEESVQTLFQTYKTRTQPVLTNQVLQSIQFRFWIVPIVHNQTLEGMVLVGHPIDNIQQSLTSLLVTLGVVFAFLIIPTLVGGYLLAQRAMQPLAQFSLQLDQITSSNLNQRIESPKTRDELEHLGVKFNQLLDRLTTAFERERQLIGDLAHELKTPLAILRSTAELALTKDRIKEKYKETIAEMIIDADRLGNTLQQILDLAWSKTEVATFTAQDCNISSVLNGLFEIVQKLTAAKHLKVSFDITPNIQVLGKDDKLARAFLNLIDNAIKYTPDQGTIQISLIKKDGLAVFTVKDTGLGIAKEDIPHIFDRFYRGNKTVKTLGSGLGLAITKAIIEAHSGKIKIKSQVGKGTCARIILPMI